MIYEAEICFLADNPILVALIASANSILNLIGTPEPSYSSSVSLQVLLDSKTTHMGEAQIKSNCITKQSEPESLASSSDPLFFDSKLTHVGCRQRFRDMSGLSLCLCGVRVQPGDIGSI